jgi:hypothetical protein
MFVLSIFAVLASFAMSQQAHDLRYGVSDCRPNLDSGIR